MKNDTPFDPEEIKAFLKREGVTLRYRDVQIQVTKEAMSDARLVVMGYGGGEIAKIRRSVAATLARNYRKLQRTPGVKRLMDDFVEDLKIWTILREAEEGGGPN